MLKPTEREALSDWWRDTGRHYCEGAATVLISFFVPLGLLFGLTIN